MYNGYLIKIGTYEVPMKFIIAKSYDVTKNIMDKEAYRDATGVLHRTALAHSPIKVNWQTPSGLTNSELQELLGAIRGQYTVAGQRMATVTLYVPEIDDYVTQSMYQPDPQMVIATVVGNEITYESVKMTFIGY